MIYIEKKVSEKTKKEYIAMYVDVRDHTYLITYEKAKILDIFDLKPSDLINLEVNYKLILLDDSKKVGE